MGTATQHDAVKENDANMSLKAKTCKRVQPKQNQHRLSKAPRCVLQISDKAAIDGPW